MEKTVEILDRCTQYALDVIAGEEIAGDYVKMACQRHLDDLEKVAAVLSDAHILVTGLSVSGDTLEDYFLSKIGGSENVKSPKY